MASEILLPDAEISNGGSAIAVGAATTWQALADSNPVTYVQGVETNFKVGLGSLALTGEIGIIDISATYSTESVIAIRLITSTGVVSFSGVSSGGGTVPCPEFGSTDVAFRCPTASSVAQVTQRFTQPFLEGASVPDWDDLQLQIILYGPAPTFDPILYELSVEMFIETTLGYQTVDTQPPHVISPPRRPIYPYYG